MATAGGFARGDFEAAEVAQDIADREAQLRGSMDKTMNRLHRVEYGLHHGRASVWCSRVLSEDSGSAVCCQGTHAVPLGAGARLPHLRLAARSAVRLRSRNVYGPPHVLCNEVARRRVYHVTAPRCPALPCYSE